MTHDILAELGYKLAPEPGVNDDIEKALAPDASSTEPPTADEIIEQELQTQKESWFLSTAEPPVVAARWNNGQWEVIVQDGTGPQMLDPRKRNLLHKAMTIALRRHERSNVFQNRVRFRKTDVARKKEIDAALAKSKAEGTLVEYPGQLV